VESCLTYPPEILRTFIPLSRSEVSYGFLFHRVKTHNPCKDKGEGSPVWLASRCLPSLINPISFFILARCGYTSLSTFPVTDEVHSTSVHLHKFFSLPSPSHLWVAQVLMEPASMPAQSEKSSFTGHSAQNNSHPISILICTLGLPTFSSCLNTHYQLVYSALLWLYCLPLSTGSSV
jgi:hypothetical protein